MDKLPNIKQPTTEEFLNGVEPHVKNLEDLKKAYKLG